MATQFGLGGNGKAMRACKVMRIEKGTGTLVFVLGIGPVE